MIKRYTYSMNILSKHHELIQVPVDDVLPAPFNPPNRTEKVDDLKKSIAAQGQLEPGHAVRFPNGTVVLADAHRRKEAIVQLGLPTIALNVYDGGDTDTEATEMLHQLYVELNAPKMTLKNAQMVVSHLKGGPTFSNQVASTVNYLKRLFDPEEYAMLVRANVGSYLVSVAKRVTKYAFELNPGTKSFDNKVRVVLLWLIRHQTQQASIAYMRNKFSPKVFANAINRDQSYVPKVQIG